MTSTKAKPAPSNRPKTPKSLEMVEAAEQSEPLFFEDLLLLLELLPELLPELLSPSLPELVVVLRLQSPALSEVAAASAALVLEEEDFFFDDFLLVSSTVMGVIHAELAVGSNVVVRSSAEAAVFVAQTADEPSSQSYVAAPILTSISDAPYVTVTPL